MTMPVHPVTGLSAIGFTSRGPIWPVRGGSETHPEGDGPQPPATGDGDQPEGEEYPPDTYVADMTMEQQRNYWKQAAQRHEARAKDKQQRVKGLEAERERLRAKAEQFDALTRTAETDQSRAVAEAVERTKRETRAELAPVLMKSALTAAFAGRTVGGKPVDVKTIAEGLDPAKFVGDDGEVDEEAVMKFADSVAPKPTGTSVPDMGQGRREGTIGKGAQAGVEEAKRRFGDKAVTTTGS